MNASNFASRRRILKATGVSFGLPFLASIAPRHTLADTSDATPRRMVCLCNNLGLHSSFFVPEGEGYDYKASRYTKIIEDLRDQFTVFSGVSHPEVDGAHSAEKSFLTTAPHPGSSSFRNSISLDQYAVDYIGKETRFPSLSLSANGQSTLSWTRAGVPIPGATSPSRLFAKLFLNGTKEEIDEQILKLRLGKSIMDTVRDQAGGVVRKMNATDRRKFDEYVTSVREVEQQMVRQQQWQLKPKPTVDMKRPRDISGRADVIGKSDLMLDLAYLAIQTDSTRIITIMMQGHFDVPPIEGVDKSYHGLSHHGQKPESLEQLALIESEHMRIFGEFLRKLHGFEEGGDTLLDRTMVLYGSNLGNASNHDTRNLPIMLAGGGFRHGQHLAFDRENNYTLGNLYVSMLQRLGIETDRFGSGTTTMRGLEMA